FSTFLRQLRREGDAHALFDGIFENVPKSLGDDDVAAVNDFHEAVVDLDAVDDLDGATAGRPLRKFRSERRNFRKVGTDQDFGEEGLYDACRVAEARTVRIVGARAQQQRIDLSAGIDI